MENLFFKKVLEMLNANKEFPKYQLERRVDIYFNIFLPDIIRSFCEKGDCVIDPIIPEFPIKVKSKKLQGSLDSKETHESFHSWNVDYFAYCRNTNTIFFIELKTDVFSCSRKQFARYFELLNSEFEDLDSDLLKIRKKTLSRYRYKYDKLIAALPEGIKKPKKRLVYILPREGRKGFGTISSKDEAKITFIYTDELKDKAKITAFEEEWKQFMELEIFD